METKVLELDAEAVDTLLVLLKNMSEQSVSVIQKIQERGEDTVDYDLAMQTMAVVSLYKHIRKANKKFEVAELEKLFEIDADDN